MIGLGGAGFRYGIVAANWDWIGSFVAMILAAFIFIPLYWRTRVYTIPEFLGRRYNGGVRTLHAVIWLLILVFDVGIVFHATALLMGTLLGWSYWVCVAGIAAVVVIYLVGAGLTAVVLTDVIQIVVMMVGGLAAVGLGMWKVGGWDGLVAALNAGGHSDHLELYRPPDGTTPYPWTGILFGLGMVMSTAYFIGNQTIVQRCLGARSEWDAKASMLVGACLKALIPVLVVTPGLIALVLYADQIPEGKEDMAFPILIKNLLPPGLVGLMFAAFVAAMMSSIDSILNAAATLFTKDIYQAFLRPDAGDAELVKTGRIATVVILVASVAAAPMSTRFAGIYEFIQTLMSVVAGPTLAILILGMFWRRCTQWGGFFALLVGCVSAFLMNLSPVASRLFSIEDPFLYVSFWSFVLSLVIAVVVSLFTRPWDEERLAPLMWKGRTSATSTHPGGADGGA